MRSTLPAALTLLAALAPSIEAQSGYVRLVEDAEGEHVALELAIREFAPPPGEDGPTVALVSAIHIGDAAYYGALQRYLDARDLVLFERVEPARAIPQELVGAPPAELDRVRATERRLRSVALALERHRRARRELPDELDALAAGDARLARACADGWGRALRYRVTGATFALTSLGADGEPGGVGADADLAFADQAPIDPGELSGEGGMQKDLADALGLVFQLEAVDYNGARWRNSDLSIEEVMARVRERGGEGAAGDLFGALAGDSFFADVAGGLIRILGMTSSGRGIMKLVGVEVLARADQLMAEPPGEMKELMEVLIHDRNAAVIDDVRDVLAGEAERRSIAIFYGAAHMPDLERALVEELGYRRRGEAWLPGVTLDTTDLGLSAKRVNTLRDLIRSSLDLQLGPAPDVYVKRQERRSF